MTNKKDNPASDAPTPNAIPLGEPAPEKKDGNRRPPVALGDAPSLNELMGNVPPPPPASARIQSKPKGSGALRPKRSQARGCYLPNLVKCSMEELTDIGLTEEETKFIDNLKEINSRGVPLTNPRIAAEMGIFQEDVAQLADYIGEKYFTKHNRTLGINEPGTRSY